MLCLRHLPRCLLIACNPLLIVPQQRQSQSAAGAARILAEGDVVLTSVGIYGVITEIVGEVTSTSRSPRASSSRYRKAPIAGRGARRDHTADERPQGRPSRPKSDTAPSPAFGHRPGLAKVASSSPSSLSRLRSCADLIPDFLRSRSRWIVDHHVGVGNKPQFGLDLQGGISVVLRPAADRFRRRLDQAIEIIRNRVDALGVAEPEIGAPGQQRSRAAARLEDQQRALDLVGTTAELRFRPVLRHAPARGHSTLDGPGHRPQRHHDHGADHHGRARRLDHDDRPADARANGSAELEELVGINVPTTPPNEDLAEPPSCCPSTTATPVSRSPATSSARRRSTATRSNRGAIGAQPGRRIQRPGHQGRRRGHRRCQRAGDLCVAHGRRSARPAVWRSSSTDACMCGAHRAKHADVRPTVRSRSPATSPRAKPTTSLPPCAMARCRSRSNRRPTQTVSATLGSDAMHGRHPRRPRRPVLWSRFS